MLDVGFSDGIPLESSKVVKEAMEEAKNSIPLSATRGRSWPEWSLGFNEKYC